MPFADDFASNQSLLQQLTPKWEKLANVFAGDASKVLIGKVDATEEEELASRCAAVLLSSL